MATNIWQHPSVIAQEALVHLEDALVIAPLCAVDKTSDFTTRSNGWKVGDTVSYRTHGEYRVDEFNTAITPQAITTSTRPLQIEKHFDVSVELTARELALDLDDFSAQVLKPAAYKLAETCDTYLGTKILQAAGLYTSTDLMGSAADAALARKAAIIQQLNMEGRYVLVDLDLEAKLLGQTWYNQAYTRGNEGTTTLRTGQMGTLMGMQWFSSIAFPTNLTGFAAGSGTTTTDNGTDKNVIGDKVLVVASATGFKAGDRIQVAGLRRPLIVAEDGSGTEIKLVDPITELVPDAAAVTVIGSGKNLVYRGAIFDKKSIAVAFPMLDLPDSETAGVASANGISVRVVKSYDIVHKVTTFSMDFLCGAFMLDPRHVTLLAEAS